MCSIGTLPGSGMIICKFGLLKSDAPHTLLARLRRSSRGSQPWTPPGPEGSNGSGNAERRDVAGADS